MEAIRHIGKQEANRTQPEYRESVCRKDDERVAGHRENRGCAI
jgi:hypothetical protein